MRRASELEVSVPDSQGPDLWQAHPELGQSQELLAKGSDGPGAEAARQVAIRGATRTTMTYFYPDDLKNDNGHTSTFRRRRTKCW